ncbi:MAG: DUF4115 domain-containing protein, partial [Synergistaceae bacterium]|nr:DUF4115 domain-containing protein [Synergistaceae bacterium]
MALKVNPQENTREEDNGAKQINELGNKLRTLREAQGISLEEGAAATKIQKKYLAAIEAGELDKLPRGPYCRSFLRQYCEYLNAGDLWDKYDRLTRKDNEALRDYKKQEREEAASYSGTPRVFRQSSRLWVYLLVALSLGGAAWVTWQYRGDIRLGGTTPLDGGTAVIAEREKSELPPPEAPAAVSAEIPPQPAGSVDLGWMDGKAPAESAPLSEEAPAPAAVPAPPAPAKPIIKVTPTGVIWIKFSIGNDVLFEGLLKPGEEREYAPRENAPLRVRYGNPGRSSISWFGSESAP